MPKVKNFFLRLCAVIIFAEWFIIISRTPGWFFIFIAPWVALLGWGWGSYNAPALADSGEERIVENGGAK